MENRSGRQEVIAAEVGFTYADLTSGAAVAAVEIPDKATIVGGMLVVDTAFNSGTSDAADIGFGTDPNGLVAAANLQATGKTDLTITGDKTDSIDTIDITWTGAGAAPSAGAGRLIVEYVVSGRARFSQG